jgi:hypothetical protein
MHEVYYRLRCDAVQSGTFKPAVYVFNVEVLTSIFLVSTRSSQKSLSLHRTVSFSTFPVSKMTARLGDWRRIQNEPWESSPLFQRPGRYATRFQASAEMYIKSALLWEIT